MQPRCKCPPNMVPTEQFSRDNIAEHLDRAGAVATFLAEVTPHLSADKNGLGLSERGARGLALLMEAVEKRISAAVDLL